MGICGGGKSKAWAGACTVHRNNSKGVSAAVWGRAEDPKKDGKLRRAHYEWPCGKLWILAFLLIAKGKLQSVTAIVGFQQIAFQEMKCFDLCFNKELPWRQRRECIKVRVWRDLMGVRVHSVHFHWKQFGNVG